MIFEEPEDFQSGKLGVLRELAALPTGKPFRGANPKGPVARGDQTPDLIGREMLVGRRLPGNVSDTIETEQAKLGSQPEIAVGCLGEGENGAFGKALADSPRRVRVLADVQCRIQRERAGASRQQNPGQHTAHRESVSSSASSPHIAHVLSHLIIRFPLFPELARRAVVFILSKRGYRSTT